MQLLTDLSFLNIGEKWTPLSQRHRLDMYETNKELYEGNFYEAYYETYQKIKTRYGLSDDDLEQIMIPIALFGCLVEIYSDLTLVDEPLFTCTRQKELDSIIENTKYNKELLEQAFIDAYSMGNGIFRVSRIDNKAKIDVITPDLWFPVVKPDNKCEYTHHVIAWKYEDSVMNWLGVVEKYYLKVEIHERGKMTEQVYELDRAGNIIKKLSEQEYIFADDWAGFLIFPFNFGVPSWRAFGLDNFTNIISLIEEITVRVSNNSKILDENADPTLLAPPSALEHDPLTGQRYYPNKSVLQIPKMDEKPSYLTWEGNLTNSETQINRLMDFFYMITGTNPQIFGKDLDGNLSGAALMKIFMRPLKKANRYIKNMKPACIDTLTCAMAMEGIKNVEISAEFKEANFETIDDISERMIGQKTAGIRSIESAVRKINPHLDDKAIIQEVKSIENENQITIADVGNIGVGQND